MSNMQKLQEKAKTVMADAERIYGIDMSQVRVTFDLKGAAAGQARWRFNRHTGNVWDLTLRLNLRMCSEDMDDALNDTIPHEVAHLVNVLDSTTGANHNSGWRNVCLRLGGTGKTYHQQEVIYGKGKTYAYTATCGTVQNVSEQRHRKIQQGAMLKLKRGGTISRSCEYKVVGSAGRRVNSPVTYRAGVRVDTTQQPVQQAAKKPTTPTEPKVQADPKPNKTATKADQVRDAIARCKRLEYDRSVAVAFAVDELGMKPTLARKYVKNNWDKV